MKAPSLKLAALILLSSLVIACSKEDDDAQPTNEEQLSGRWDLTDIDASGTISFMGQTIPFVTTNSTIDPGSYFDFSLNPQEVDYDASATVEISAGTTFDVPYARSGQGTWQLKGRDSLIVTEQGQVTRYYILGCSDTRLTLRSQQVVTFSGQNIDAEVEAVLER